MKNDTRGWKPKSTDNGAEIAGSRTGVNKHDTTIAKVNYPSGAARIDERGVTQDNMGNSVMNKGAQRPVFPMAKTTNNAPSLPMSSYEGVECVDGKGCPLTGDFKTEIAQREVRPWGDQAPASSARMGGMTTSSGSDTWKKARLPFGGKTDEQFKGDGNNPGGVEQVDGQKAVHARGKANFKPKSGK